MTDNNLDLNEQRSPDFIELSNYVFEISEEFERDCRRYDRAFTEEKEVM